MARWKGVLDLVTTAVVLTAAGAILVKVFASPAGGPGKPVARPIPEEPISISGAPSRGSQAAPVALLVYSDYQCPACRAAAKDLVPIVVREFVDTGLVRLIYRHLPLSRIHPSAILAAAAADCAGEQGQFWPMHDKLIMGSEELDWASIRRRAKEVSLDQSTFDACLDGGGMVTKVEEQGQAARRLGILSTPVFLIGLVQTGDLVRAVERVDGAGGIENLQSAVRRVIDRARKSDR